MNDRPWFISLLLGIAGWFAGALVLVLVGSTIPWDSAAARFFVAVVLLATAFFIYKADKDNAFLDQLALAFSIAGQLAILLMMTEVRLGAAATAGALAALQFALLFVMPNRLARAIAALFACVAWALMIQFIAWDAKDYVSAYPNPEVRVDLSRTLLSWGVTWLPLIAFAWIAIGKEAGWMASRVRPIVRAALKGVLVALPFGTLASMPFRALTGGFDSRPMSGWAVLWPLLALATAMFAIVCALRLRSRALAGLAIAGALLHVVHFYYLLGMSLLMKSAIMLIVGIVFLMLGSVITADRSARS